ncbi:MAG: twin-arginine translocase TatA/TatE family subunit [Nitrososphaerota archaeon]|nr:twin-arginine translocase TatA/TatE family subunit [Nitrososphaerota archaeon]
MALDDPVVWILIIAVIVFLFGASKIPALARSLGEARKEFDKGWKGEQSGNNQQQSAGPLAPDDPLIAAAQKEGIETQGKTREQIASELSWKLNKK